MCTHNTYIRIRTHINVCHFQGARGERGFPGLDGEKGDRGDAVCHVHVSRTRVTNTRVTSSFKRMENLKVGLTMDMLAVT